MAHFAEIDNNNIVIRVLVVPNEQEHRGQEYLADDLGLGGTWLQTSYNSKIRKHYAGVGFTYDSNLDAFIPPRPYNSWLLNSTDALWYAPVPYPTDGQSYVWDENVLNWVLLQTT